MADNTIDRYISQIRWGGRNYALKDFTAAESAEIAQTAATQANKAHVAALHVVSSTRQLIGGDEIIEYDSSKTYHKDDICAYNGRIWILTATSTTGVWDATVWEETSFWNELNKMRQPTDNVELLHLHVCKESTYSFDHDFPNAVVNVTVNNETTTYTANTAGVLILQFPFGTDYTLSFPDQSYDDGTGTLVPYNTPEAITLTPRMNQRNISVTYTKQEVNWSVIYKDGYEVPLDEHYDAITADTAIDGRKNADVQLLRISKHVLDAQMNQYHINFCLPVRTTANCGPGSNLPWQENPWNTQLSRPVAIGTADTAKFHFGGYKETMEILDSCANIGATSKAALYATRCYVVINGTKIYGRMMSSGEIHQVLGTDDLRAQYQAACQKCGATYYNLKSGGWWSSSQYGANGAWTLYNGSLNNRIKTSSYSVLPVFDF